MLWDDDGPEETPAPYSSGPRGAWRAPSAVLSDRRTSAGAPTLARHAGNADPDSDPDSDLDEPIPRRSRSFASRTPWWRPRTTFGRVLLGAAAFLLLAGLATAGIVTRQFLIRDAHFRIPGASSIASNGLTEVTRAEVLPVFGEDIGRNIFFVPLPERRKQLEAIPWVKQATVMRFLPDNLSVSIVERTPVAFVRTGLNAQNVELVDADGVILSMPPAMLAQHHYSFPVVIGINPKDSPAARRTRMAVYQRFVTELDSGGRHLSKDVSEIDLTDPEDLRAWMPEQNSDVLAHFGDAHFLERLQMYQAHIAEWRARYPRLKGVDLRFSGEVPLEMATESPAGDARSADPAGPAKPSASPVAGSKPATQAAGPPNPGSPTPSAQVKAVKSAQLKPGKKAPPPTAAARRSAEAKKRAARLKTAKAQAGGHKSAASSKGTPAVRQ